MHRILPVVLAGLVLAAKYGLIVIAVGYVLKKGVSLVDAFTSKAKAEGKRVKFASVLDSLSHFLATGVQKEAQATQNALASGKPAPEVGSICLQAVKDYLKSDGLKELQDVLGLVTGADLEAHLKVLSTAAVKQANASAPASPK